MKVLFIFCDMLRANILKTFNGNVEKNSQIDDCFKKLGGTAYTKCYCPGPDTGRGMGCFYSGRYPKYNGCTKRAYWPLNYLKKDTFNIFELFKKHNYNMLTYLEKRKVETGFFPRMKYDKLTNYYKFDDFIDKLSEQMEKEKDVFSFASISDYHWAISDYGSNKKGDRYGQKHVANCLDRIFDKIEPDAFDYIVLFSDHGFKAQQDLKENKLRFLNDDRTRIVMMVRKKGAKKIEKKDNLTTIMDVFPTFMDILHDKTDVSLDGVSLFKEKKDRCVIIEDYYGFFTEIGRDFELWGARTDKYFYITNVYDSMLLKDVKKGKFVEEKNPDEKMIKEFEKKIIKDAISFEGNKEIGDVLKRLRKRKDKTPDRYADGDKRVNSAMLRKVNKGFYSVVFKNKF